MLAVGFVLSAPAKQEKRALVPSPLPTATATYEGCFSHIDQTVNNEVVFRRPYVRGPIATWSRQSMVLCQQDVCDVLGKQWFAMEETNIFGGDIEWGSSCIWGADSWDTEGVASGCDASVTFFVPFLAAVMMDMQSVLIRGGVGLAASTKSVAHNSATLRW